MASKSPDVVLREVLAALIGSRLTVADMKMFAQLLDNDRYFRQELVNILFEVAGRLGSQASFDLRGVNEDDSSYGGLTDLAYSIVQRKRMSKSKLIDLFSRFGFNPKLAGVTKDTSVKDMIEIYLNNSSSKQVEGFLDLLGLDVEQDAYLGVIGRQRP